MKLTKRQIEVLHLLNHPKAYTKLNGGRFDVWTCIRPKKGIVDVSRLDNVDIFLFRISIHTWSALYDSKMIKISGLIHIITDKGQEYLRRIKNENM